MIDLKELQRKLEQILGFQPGFLFEKVDEKFIV